MFMDNTKAAEDSMPMVATAVPNKPALWPAPSPDVRPSQYAEITAVATDTTGIMVDLMPTATPAIMLVPWPVVEARAMERTGSYA